MGRYEITIGDLYDSKQIYGETFVLLTLSPCFPGIVSSNEDGLTATFTAEEKWSKRAVIKILNIFLNKQHNLINHIKSIGLKDLP